MPTTQAWLQIIIGHIESTQRVADMFKNDPDIAAMCYAEIAELRKEQSRLESIILEKALAA